MRIIAVAGDAATLGVIRPFDRHLRRRIAVSQFLNGISSAGFVKPVFDQPRRARRTTCGVGDARNEPGF
jgi:hypothetical protein